MRKKYYVFLGDVEISETNVDSTHNTAEEAVLASQRWQEEILRGMYDKEFHISSRNERLVAASDISVYEVTYNDAGAVKRKRKL